MCCSGQVTPMGSPTARPRPVRWSGPCPSVHWAPASTQRTRGSQAPGASSHTGSRGCCWLRQGRAPSSAPQCRRDTLFTNRRKAWVGCWGPASTWELRLDPCGAACQAHSGPGPQTPDQLQATTSTRENVTPSTPAPHGDKHGQRCLLPKKNFNKVPKILCRK